jgi:NTE family protein
MAFGLVLEGGGGRGAYQIGACKAIKEMGLEISMVAGTSVGALNGAMVVQGDIDAAYDIWHELRPDRVIRLDDDLYRKIAASDYRPDTLRQLVRYIRNVLAEGGLDVTPLEKLVKSILREDRIRSSHIGFGVVTVDLTARRAVEIYKEEIPEGQLVDYVIASASFPAFKRTIIDGRTFIDGALYNNLPINLVSNRGLRDIIVLRTYGMGIKRRVKTEGLNIISISPSENLSSVMDFSNKSARRGLKLGYDDACRTLEEYLLTAGVS